MNRKSVRLIKRYQRIPQPRVLVKVVADSNQWSKSVRSWVVEFKHRDRNELLPAFDSLFKDGSGSFGGD